MEFEKDIEVINKLGTLSDKLKYYNDNVSFLIGIGNFQHQVGFGIGREQHNIFCLCEQCQDKYSISDFETYRDIRNQETQKVVDFFESTNDYKTKIEYYFKISQGFSTTTRTLFFVPDKLDVINIHKFPYKTYTIDITPKDANEITILKNHLKQKLLTDNSRVWIPMAQFTFEKRVENIQKYLKIRIEKSRREELIQSEYDKISLSKVDRSSKKPYDTTLFKILKVAEDIIQEKHNEFHTEFRKIEITILAEDTIKYEQYLNGLSVAKPDNSHLKHPESENPIVPKDITIFEKIKRELNIIHWAFKSQFEKRTTEMIYPMLHQDGRYCSSIYIRSDDALLNIEKYKIYYTKRFESTPNISLIKNELIQIYEKALFLRDFFNNNLIDNCEIVADYLEKKKEQMYSTEFSVFHTMIICVENYHPMGVLFGLSGDVKNNETAWTDKKYNYHNDNHQLAVICQKLVDFVEAFDIIEKESQQKELTNKEKNTIIPNQYFDDESKNTPISDVLEQINSDLWNWLQNYESTNEYLPIPLAIEEKTDYVVDTYKNYEERNFKYQLEICNTILEKVPNEKTIIEYKGNFEKKLIGLRKQYPIPNTNIETIILDINNALYRLEKFMDGTVLNYKSFLFNDAFTIFFNELNKLENVNVKNHKLRDGYHYFLSQLSYAYDKSEFKNQKAYKNDDFNRDFNELDYVYNHRSSEFGINVDLDDYNFEMPSILEIVNDAINNTFNQSTDIKLEINKMTPNINNKHITPVSNNYKKTIAKFTSCYENLINDPLLNPENEYIVLNKDLELERISKAIGSSDNGLFITYSYEPGFEEWEKHQYLEIGKSFLRLIKELNQNKVFFFGCSLDNYKHNYDKRLNDFSDNFYDATESDFIEGELEFLENILYDIQNSEGAHDGYSVSGYSNFSKAYNIVTSLGYKQYLFSHNKKIEFLNERKAKLFSNDLPIAELIFEEKTIHFDSQENVDKEQNNVLKSTIEDYLDEFKDEINGDGYDILVNALNEYFSNGSFPVLTSKINFKRINKKRLGWALKELHKSEKTGNLDIEYFRFAQENINLFSKEIIETDNFNKNKFYKMFTTNPAK